MVEKSRLVEFFWARVEKGPACWLWTGPTLGEGKGGSLVVDGRKTTARRVSWELTHGPIPERTRFRVTCGLETCVRPDHLRPDEAAAWHERSCESCGAPIERKTFGPGEYAKLRWCSQACANRAMNVRPLADRFWEKVTKPAGEDACWEWIAARTEKGYGQIGADGRVEIASRVAWFLEYGEWPDRFVLHTCDNPPCVRPKHLFRGTVRENTDDMLAKGRGAFGERSGHAVLTEAIVRSSRDRNAAGETVADLAREHKVSSSTMWNAIHRVTWARVL